MGLPNKYYKLTSRSAMVHCQPYPLSLNDTDFLLRDVTEDFTPVLKSYFDTLYSTFLTKLHQLKTLPTKVSDEEAKNLASMLDALIDAQRTMYDSKKQ